MSDQSNRSDEPPATVGGLLRSGRTAAKLTQEAVAVAVGVRQSTVSAWESGSAYPTPGNYVRLADLLGLDLSVLVRRAVAETAETVPA